MNNLMNKMMENEDVKMSNWEKIYVRQYLWTFNSFNALASCVTLYKAKEK